MVAEIGNKRGVAIKDPEVRQKAYKSFCEHLSKGLSYQSWYYEDDQNNSCVGRTMLSYIKENPIEFPSITKEIAESKGFGFWEGVLKDSATGKNKDASTASLQMIMRNKYGWDKPKEEEAPKNQCFMTNYQKLSPYDPRNNLKISSEKLSTSDPMGA